MLDSFSWSWLLRLDTWLEKLAYKGKIYAEKIFQVDKRVVLLLSDISLTAAQRVEQLFQIIQIT